jgi:hypothetical protein
VKRTTTTPDNQVRERQLGNDRATPGRFLYVEVTRGPVSRDHLLRRTIGHLLHTCSIERGRVPGVPGGECRRFPPGRGLGLKIFIQALALSAT